MNSGQGRGLVELKVWVDVGELSGKAMCKRGRALNDRRQNVEQIPV